MSALDDALQVAGMANAQISTKRRSALRLHIKESMQALCDKSVPFTHKMFGDNLLSSIDTNKKLNEVVDQVMGRCSVARGGKRKLFLGRGAAGVD